MAGTDPVAAGLLEPVGQLGADVAVGEGQPLGHRWRSAGRMSGCSPRTGAYVRRWLPGRLVGEGEDVEGRKAYVLTLSTREQHIRRAGASSNVCTNQTLIAVTTAIHLAWLGPQGLRELALRSPAGARYTRESLLRHPGVEPAADAPTLYEFAVRTPRPATEVLEKLAEEGFLGGLDLTPTIPTSESLAGDRDRDPHPGRDRRLRGGLREGGGVMARARECPNFSPGRAPAGRRRCRSWDATASRRCSNCRRPAGRAGPSGNRGAGMGGRGLVPAEHLAADHRPLPEVSERDLVAHFSRLSSRNYSVDHGAYPLGSCTMKYNPKLCDAVAAMPGLATVPPGAARRPDPGLARRCWPTWSASSAR